jgi:hypothetical protein
MFSVALLTTTALALECDPTADEVCAATEGIAASLTLQAGREVIRDGAPRRLQPDTVYRQLLAVTEQLALRGCSVDGWTAGLYGSPAGEWTGEYNDGEPGDWVGTYDRAGRSLSGTWTQGEEEGHAGVLFSSFNKQGQVASDLDGDRLLAGRWIRERGGRGVFALLHGSCGEEVTPFDAVDAWYAGVPTAAQPLCPDTTLVEKQVVNVDDLGITNAAGDPLTPERVLLIDGNGTQLMDEPAPSSFGLPETSSFLDERGEAVARLEAVVRDASGAATVCTLPVEPASGVLCAAELTRTVFDKDQMLKLHPADDCAALNGDDSQFRVTGVTRTEDGEPIEFLETSDGAAELLLDGGQHDLMVATEGGPPIRFTIEVRDTWFVQSGSTNEVGEGGGTIALAELVASLEDPGSDDPLEPVSVELIAPDLSTLVATDVVGDELVVPSAPAVQQGQEVVTPKLLLSVRRKGVVETHVFDVPVNRSPYCRADGPTTFGEDLQTVVPLDQWCVDPEDDSFEVIAVLREDGGEVPFSIDNGNLLFQAADACCTGPVLFTLEFRDHFRIAPNTIGTGSFTITSRDEFSAL